MKETKTKLSLKEKSELLKLRVSKFNTFVQKEHFMAGQPMAAMAQIDDVQEIWYEIKDQMIADLNKEKERKEKYG